ncbi:Fps/Fes/Fer/CIP4-like protein [Neofusicoccum parvum]|uniref:Fps/Fes/Fer/CIP4-like protein n=1 Tax=Neofusicoccum parvum TaxID=310453 RepID=A0ACB5RYL4_9PEZI|nr:Fps/Fes/Fer/CIP4-like protein [Neofusicoccum parvum]
MPGTTMSDPPSVSLSFANNFWGKDDAGVGPLLERMHNAKVTGDEMKSFYTARAHIEEEYARKLLNLSRKPLGSSESGTLKMSLDVVRAEIEAMGKQHQQIAGQMKSELEEQLSAFTGGLKERRKIVQTGIEKLLKVKMQQTSAVNKARDKFEQDSLKIKGYLAQGHMVMGHEERKNKAKLEKTQVQLSGSSQEYEQAVKILEETTARWNREWKKACDQFQDLEEERIDFMKSSLWAFANIASTVCSLEKIRLSLEDCEVEKDITNFIRDCGTGQEIPDPPKFIDFCRGDVSDDASITSEENNYTVAHPEPDSEPVDPRANFQLNVGKNVFDVASPDKRRQEATNTGGDEADPIAQALAELKAPSKQSSLRMTADRYAGLATPAPPGTPGTLSDAGGNVPTPLASSNRGMPPPSADYGGGQGQVGRVRSRSVAADARYTKDGRPIMHYSRAMYMYQAQIPEELSFNKGDILAITREQDDGWWEAEVVSKPGRVGLVPSNYLQNC